MNHKYKEIEKNLLNLTLFMGVVILCMLFWGVKGAMENFY